MQPHRTRGMGLATQTLEGRFSPFTRHPEDVCGFKKGGTEGTTTGPCAPRVERGHPGRRVPSHPLPSTSQVEAILPGHFFGCHNGVGVFLVSSRKKPEMLLNFL